MKSKTSEKRKEKNLRWIFHPTSNSVPRDRFPLSSARILHRSLSLSVFIVHTNLHLYNCFFYLGKRMLKNSEWWWHQRVSFKTEENGKNLHGGAGGQVLRLQVLQNPPSPCWWSHLSGTIFALSNSTQW